MRSESQRTQGCPGRGGAAGRLLRRGASVVLVALVLVWVGAVSADGLPDTVERVEPSVVSVGTYESTRSPRVQHRGTGFVVGDGRLVVTNEHVLPESLDEGNRERLVVISGHGRDTSMHHAEVVGRTGETDLALLRISAPSLPALRLGDSDAVRVGEKLAMTGYPIGMILGLYPATHRVSVAARTPMAIPASRSSELDGGRVAALRRGAPMVFQLDATAYPGNSGSPVYRIDSGEVVGIINQVFVQGGREAAVGRPSGISYAIPSAHVRPLLERHGRP